jgi:archaetidylinositol phosphate synthase
MACRGRVARVEFHRGARGRGKLRTKRDSRSLLAKAERSVIDRILPYIPECVSPDHLTYLGLSGAIVTGLGLAFCSFSTAFLTLALFGLFLNWFGDSFDGSLARFRSSERPRYGFLIDHSIDLISITIILMGFGISPYLPFHSACFILVTYLLFCGVVYVKVAADGVHKLDFAGLGATEFRLMVAAWVLAVNGFDLESTVNYAPIHEGPLAGAAVLDFVIGAGCCIMFLGLVHVIFREAAKLKQVEPVPFDRAKVVELLKREKQLA